MYGDPLRLVNGYDSFGNVCGSSNADMADHNDSRMSLSGYDTTDRRYVAFININPFLYFCYSDIPPYTYKYYIHMFTVTHNHESSSPICTNERVRK